MDWFITLNQPLRDQRWVNGFGQEHTETNLQLILDWGCSFLPNKSANVMCINTSTIALCAFTSANGIKSSSPIVIKSPSSCSSPRLDPELSNQMYRLLVLCLERRPHYRRHSRLFSLIPSQRPLTPRPENVAVAKTVDVAKAVITVDKIDAKRQKVSKMSQKDENEK